MNHPAGRIGKRLILRVSDVMLTGDKLPKVAPSTKVVDTLVELSGKGCGCVLIVDENNHLLGTFTDGDLRRALQVSSSPTCCPEAIAIPGEDGALKLYGTPSPAAPAKRFC